MQPCPPRGDEPPPPRIAAARSPAAVAERSSAKGDFRHKSRSAAGSGRNRRERRSPGCRAAPRQGAAGRYERPIPPPGPPWALRAERGPRQPLRRATERRSDGPDGTPGKGSGPTRPRGPTRAGPLCRSSAPPPRSPRPGSPRPSRRSPALTSCPRPAPARCYATPAPPEAAAPLQTGSGALSAELDGRAVSAGAERGKGGTTRLSTPPCPALPALLLVEGVGRSRRAAH